MFGIITTRVSSRIQRLAAPQHARCVEHTPSARYAQGAARKRGRLFRPGGQSTIACFIAWLGQEYTCVSIQESENCVFVRERRAPNK